MRIKEVEKATGITSNNIRFYEKMNLIKSNRDFENGYRCYSTEEVEKLKLIRLYRKLGISIENIQMLFSKEKSINDMLTMHIEQLDDSIDNFKTFKEICKSMLLNNHELNSNETEKYLNKFNEEQKSIFYNGEDIVSFLPDDYKLKYYESMLLNGDAEESLINDLTTYLQKLLKDSFQRERVLKELLNNCSNVEKERLVELIKDNDMNLYNHLNTYIYDIEEIPSINDNIAKKVLDDIDLEELLIALKGVSPNLQTHIQSLLCDADLISKSSSLGPVPLRDVKKIHSVIVSKINIILDEEKL